MSDSPSRILALAPNWLGDVAMCTPSLRALAARYPDAELTVAGRPAVCALLAGLPWITRNLELPPRPSLSGMVGLAKTLRPHSRDLAVVFPHSFRAALLARLTGARRRVGYARGSRGMLLTDAVPPYTENGRIAPIYMGREYLDLVAAVDAQNDDQGLELHVDDAYRETVRARLAGEGPLVGIAPGAAFGPSKMWPAERYAAVADALHKQVGARCVLITGPGEEATRDAVLAAAKHPLLRADEGRPSIALLKAVIAELDLLVGNDSGTRHIAVAFGVPVVCIMGSTSPRYSEGPYEKGRVLRVDVDCGPCQKPVCTTDHRCMTRIDPRWVTDTAREFLPTASH
jgi:heptosyltransferase-2